MQNKAKTEKSRRSNVSSWLVSRIPFALGAVVFGTVAFGAVACADPPPPVYPELAPPPPAPPPPAPPAPPPVAVKQDLVEDTGRAGRLNISSDVREACGIPENEANFGYNSDIVSLGDHPILDQITQCFRSGPLTGKRVRLVGHADPRGDEEYNFVLGERRAQAVREYMVRSGLSSLQILTTSRGELDASGIDDESWKRDRRVDVLLGN